MKISENKVATELNQSRQTFAYWKKERPEVYNTIRGYYELREALEEKTPDIEAMRKIIENVSKNVDTLTKELEGTTVTQLAQRFEEAKSDKVKFKVLADYRAALKKYPEWKELQAEYMKNKRS